MTYRPIAAFIALLPWLCVATLKAQNSAPAITVSPNQGPNNQAVTVAITGSDELNGATVKLTAAGEADLPAIVTTLSPSVILATFNLEEPAPGMQSGPAPPGVRDLTVRTADGASLVIPRAFTITQAPQCTYSVTPSSISVGVSGGQGTFYVTTPVPPACLWVPVVRADWITIVSPPVPQCGPQAPLCAIPDLGYPVAANNTGEERSAAIDIQAIGSNVTGTVGTVTIAQAGPCSFSLDSNGYTFSFSGGEHSVRLTAPAGCDWSVNGSLPSWLNLPAGNSGSGSGAIELEAEDNSGVSRSVKLTIAGKQFTVSQAAGSACGAVDASGSIHVTYLPATLWFPFSKPPEYSVKFTLSNTSSQTVPGPIYLVLDNLPNTTAAPCLTGGCYLITPAPLTHCQAPTAAGSYLILASSAAMAPGSSITFGELLANDPYGIFTTRVLRGRRMNREELSMKRLALTFVFTAALGQADAVYNFSLNTAPLESSSAGPFSFAFGFADGSGTGDDNNAVAVTNFAFGGGRVSGATLRFGSASGDIATAAVLTDAVPTADFVQPFIAGSVLSFDVFMTTNVDSGGIPDVFTFSDLMIPLACCMMGIGVARRRPRARQP